MNIFAMQNRLKMKLKMGKNSQYCFFFLVVLLRNHKKDANVFCVFEPDLILHNDHSLFRMPLYILSLRHKIQIVYVSYRFHVAAVDVDVPRCMRKCV